MRHLRPPVLAADTTSILLSHHVASVQQAITAPQVFSTTAILREQIPQLMMTTTSTANYLRACLLVLQAPIATILIPSLKLHSANLVFLVTSAPAP